MRLCEGPSVPRMLAHHTPSFLPRSQFCSNVPFSERTFLTNRRRTAALTTPALPSCVLHCFFTILHSVLFLHHPEFCVVFLHHLHSALFLHHLHSALCFFTILHSALCFFTALSSPLLTCVFCLLFFSPLVPALWVRFLHWCILVPTVDTW